MAIRGRLPSILMVTAAVAMAACGGSKTSSGSTTTASTVSANATTAGSVASNPSPTTVPATSGAAPTNAPATATGGPSSSSCGTAKLVVGFDLDPVQIDPQQLPQTLGAYTVIDAVYDTLAYYADGKPAPRLATSWTESADRLTWTVKIRQGVTFSDGTALTANVVKENLSHQRTSQSNGPALSNISALDAPDAETLKVKLKAPWASFPNMLTQFYTSVVAPSALRGSDLARKPVGTGPFTLTEWKPNDRVVLACNDHYWGDKPRVATVEFRYIPDETARLAALKAGDIDAAWLLLKESIEGAQADKQFTTVRGPYAGQSITLFNDTTPPLDDVRVRSALVKALDVQALNDAFATPGSEPAVGPFSKEHPWFTKTDYPTYDVAGAKTLIAEYTAANGGKPPSITFSYTASGNQLIDDLIAAVKQYWEAVGVEVKLDKQADGTAFVTQVVLGQYQVAGFVAGMDPDPDLTLYNAYHQLGAFNFEHYKNAQLSDLLDKGRQAATDAERHPIYDQIQQIIAKDVPIAFGTFTGSWVAASSRVSGLEQFKTFVFPTRLIGVRG